MLVTDPVLGDVLAGMGIAFVQGKPQIAGLSLELICGAIGVAVVVLWGLALAKRADGEKSNS
jgi:hypothetical protein